MLKNKLHLNKKSDRYNNKEIYICKENFPYHFIVIDLSEAYLAEKLDMFFCC